MSVRAYVLTQYEVAYGSSGLGYGQQFLLALSSEYMTCAYTGGEEQTDEAIWEFDIAQFKAMTETLSKMTAEEYNNKCKEWDVNPNDYPQDYVVKLFYTWLEESPEIDGYLRIHWL